MSLIGTSNFLTDTSLWYALEAAENEEKSKITVDSCRKRKREKNRERLPRIYSLEEVDNLSESTFRTMFRMSRPAFNVLFEKIEPFLLDTDERMAIRSSYSGISKKAKLYVTLRWLAGGSHLDLCFAWGISKAAFYSTDPKYGVIWPTISAIDKVLTIGIPYDDVDKLETLAKGFDKFTSCNNGEMFGCVTAIDGWVCATRKPTRDEVTDIISYRNRHDCWGLLVLAGCDADLKFTMFSVKNSGSTNDMMAWELSENYHLLMHEKRLPDKYYFIGDEAFVCTDQFLVPFSGRSLERSLDTFNYNLSAMRQCIERAFAALTQRWGILWRYIRIDYERWPLLLSTIAKLHNFCIENNVLITDFPRAYEDCGEDREASVFEPYLGEVEPDADDSITKRNGKRRREMAERLRDSGIRRPTPVPRTN